MPNEVSDDLSEGLQGALGPNLGPAVLPRAAEDSPEAPIRAPRAPRILKKSCSGLGESMIFKIDEKKVNEQEKHK